MMVASMVLALWAAIPERKVLTVERAARAIGECSASHLLPRAKVPEKLRKRTRSPRAGVRIALMIMD